MSWLDALKVYRLKSVRIMLFLGFSAGLPLLLVFSTLTAWLRDFGLSKTTIGFFAWVGITYSVKVFWAPFVDQLNLPVLTRLVGKRRSWLFLAQGCIALGLLVMSQIDPTQNLLYVALAALLVAFCSATQDIVIDAYRIEIADDQYQGALATTYNLGYRIAMLFAGAGALYIADGFSWSTAYMVMALTMCGAMLITMLIHEPDHLANGQSSYTPLSYEWFIHAVIHPFTDFFKRNGWFSLTLLLFVGVFRLSDITMGIMANPFYLDLGFSKTDIANIGKVFGFFMTILGSFLGGLLVVKMGVIKPLLIGAISVALTNLLFAQLAMVGADISWLVVTISADNLCAGLAGAVFIAYLSSLTNRSYTATQYALFSSLMTLPGKFISGFSGIIVDAQGYAVFFIYAAVMGVPAIILAYIIMRRESQA